MENLSKFEKWGPFFMRVGLGITFLLFGYQKLAYPEQASAEVSAILSEWSILSSISSYGNLINFYMGIFEIAISAALIIGFYTRIAALFASALLVLFFASIVFTYGFFNDQALWRDIGLIGSSLAIAVIGPGKFALDNNRTISS